MSRIQVDSGDLDPTTWSRHVATSNDFNQDQIKSLPDFKFSVLNCLYDTVSIMLRKNVEKRQMMKQLDGIFLAVDEICDRGIILEIEPNDVIDKVSTFGHFLF